MENSGSFLCMRIIQLTSSGVIIIIEIKKNRNFYKVSLYFAKKLLLVVSMLVYKLMISRLLLNASMRRLFWLCVYH